jgi:hypothetical protein
MLKNTALHTPRILPTFANGKDAETNLRMQPNVGAQEAESHRHGETM